MKSTVNKGQRKLCQEDADSLTLFKTLLCAIRCLIHLVFLVLPSSVIGLYTKLVAITNNQFQE